MPKKKQVRNGFYWYMQDLIPELRREGQRVNGIADAVPLAHPRWKALSKEDKDQYEEKARIEKRKAQGQSSTGKKDTRLDNVGQVIAYRISPEEEAMKRRSKESRITLSRWPQGPNAAEEMLDYQFYFIAFEYMCETDEKEYLPVEVAAVEFTMRSGITNKYHKFVKPGSIPLGYRFQCMQHSEETHQIPVEGFELADDNYRGIYIQLENFINYQGKKREYPPFYVLGVNIECVEYCLDWIHKKALIGHHSRLQKVFELENMVVDLIQKGHGPMTGRPTVLEVLGSTTWDYEPNTRCPYHEEIGNRFCALYTVQKTAYLLSDFLADIYKFDLKPGFHQPLPVECDIVQVYPLPQNLGMKKQPRPQPQSLAYENSSGVLFGGRDIRQQERLVIALDDSDEDDDSDTDFDSVLEMELSQTARRPNLPDTSLPWGAGRGTGLAAGQIGPYSGAGRGAPLMADNDFPALGAGRGDPMMDEDDFPALGAPGPAKPRRHTPSQAPGWSSSSTAHPPSWSSLPSSQSSFKPSGPPSLTSSAASSAASTISDREPKRNTKQEPRKKTLREAIVEREQEEQMRNMRKPASQEPQLAQLVQSTNIAGVGRGALVAPRSVNINNPAFKPSLGNVTTFSASLGQGRGVVQSDAIITVGRGGRGRGNATSLPATSGVGRGSLATPRPVNSSAPWGAGRGAGVTPSESSYSTEKSESSYPGWTASESSFPGLNPRDSSAVSESEYSLLSHTVGASSVYSADTESLVSTTVSSQSAVGRGMGVWKNKRPPPGFGADVNRKMQEMAIQEQFSDS